METAKNPREEFMITRVFEAPRDLLWQAWTDPETVKKWWGPKLFTASVIKMDVREGGTYLGCLRGPDGRDYWSGGTYREVVSQERIVAADHFADAKGNYVPASYYGMPGDAPQEQMVAVEFHDLGGKTRMTLHVSGMVPGQMTDMAVAGWNESFDKLAAHLAAAQSRQGADLKLGPVLRMNFDR